MTLSSHAAHQDGPAARNLTDRLELVGFMLAVAYLAFLIGAGFQGQWLVNQLGQPVPSDFVNVFAAGKLVLQGHAAAAYDWTIHKQAEYAAVGHDFGGYYN